MADAAKVEELKRRLAEAEAALRSHTREAALRQRAEAALRRSEQHYRALFDSIDEGFCVIEVLFDAEGRPSDYRFLQVNPAFERQTGLSDAVGRTMRQLAASHEQHWFDTYGRIARTGVPERFEDRAEALGRWHDVYAFRIGEPDEHQVAILFQDVIDRKRTEAALRDSEEQHRLMLELVPVLLWRADPAGHAILTDGGWQRYTGQRDDEIQDFGWLDAIHPDDLLATHDAFAQAFATGEPLDLEHRIRGPDGYRWHFVRHAPVRDEQGVIRHWFGAAIDVDGQHELRAAQQFLLKLSDALRPLADPVEIIAAASRLTGEYLRLDRCGYGEVDPAAEHLFFPGTHVAPSVPPFPERVRLEDFSKELVAIIAAGETLVVDDIRAEPRLADPSQAQTFLAAHVAAFVGVPLIKRGRLVALLSAHQTSPRQWKQSDIAVLEDVAERTWAAVERARAEGALHASEEKYRTLFASMTEGFCIVETVRDADGRLSDLIYREANDAYAAQAGFQPYPGLRVKEVAPDIEDEWIAFCDRVSSTGVPETKESFNTDLKRWFRTRASRVGPDGSPLLGIVFEDVTDRKRAEQVVRDSEVRQTFLLQLSDALRPLADPAEIMETTSALLGHHLRVGRCGYGEVDATGEFLFVARDWTDGAMDSLAGTLRLEDFGDALISAYRAGRTVVVDDVYADARARGVEAAFEEIGGLRASLAVPLVKDNRWVAVFYVQQSTARHWTPDEQTLVRDVAERTWAAVERSRAEAALRHSEQQLALSVEIGAIGHWEYDIATGELTTSAICRRNFGRPEDQEFSYEELTASIHPDDRARQEQAVGAAAANRSRLQIEYRLITPAGETRSIEVRGQFVDGENLRLVGVSQDITARKVAEAALRESEGRLQVLVAELRHRVRNILTVVRSVFARTTEAGGTAEDIAQHFRGRLDSLARTQVVVTQSATGLVDLENLIRDELLSVGATDGPTLTIAGPDVALRSQDAESMGLAIHELTTNALKYGALKVEGATLDIQWSVNMGCGDDRRLNLTWREQGVPAVSVRPSRYGFGSELIEEALPYRLGAETKLEFRGGGVCCSISMPLPDPGASAADPLEGPRS